MGKTVIMSLLVRNGRKGFDNFLGLMSEASPNVNLEILQETYKQLNQVFEQQYPARQGTLSPESVVEKYMLTK